MGKFGWIVFLVIIVANVIGPFLKKQSEEKARKQRQQGSGQPDSPTQHSAASDSPSVSPGSSRLERLAARRMAQLEELRGRREQRRSETSTQQARIGPASTPTTTTLRPTAFRAPAPQPTRPATRPAPTQPSASRPSPAKQSPPQPAQRRRLSRQPAAQPVQRKRLVELHEKPAATAPSKAAPKPFLSLGGQTITPQLLRRLVVLKEIFDPPIALRTRDIWDRPG